MHHKVRQSGKKKRIFVVHNFKTCNNEEEAKELWSQQVQKIYRSGKSGSRTKGREIFLHDSHIGRHVFIANLNSDFGKMYNPLCLDSLKDWLEGAVSETELIRRHYVPLEEISRYSQILINSYIENPRSIQYLNNEFIMELEEDKPQPTLKPWKVERFSIIFDSNRQNLDDNNVLWNPKMRVIELEDRTKLKVTADLPGLKEKEYHLDFQKNETVLSGERKRPEEFGSITLNELEFGKFDKTIIIPEIFSSEPESTIYENGVLTIIYGRFKSAKLVPCKSCKKPIFAPLVIQKKLDKKDIVIACSLCGDDNSLKDLSQELSKMGDTKVVIK